MLAQRQISIDPEEVKVAPDSLDIIIHVRERNQFRIAKVDIKKGETFSELNLTTKRPGSGINPMKWDYIIGQIADKDYLEDDLI